MTINEFNKQIANETGTDLNTVKKVTKAFQDKIMDIIAENDCINFSFGTIRGYIKPSKKIGGFYSVYRTVKKNGGWSMAKSGYPKMDWSSKALMCTEIEPEVFFSLEEYRYTSDAKDFRIDNGLPEIPEFSGLTDEEIDSICESADKRIMDDAVKNLTPKKKKDLRRKMRYSNKGKNYAKERVMWDYWEKQKKRGVPEEVYMSKTYKEIVEENRKEWEAINNKTLLDMRKSKY